MSLALSLRPPWPLTILLWLGTLLVGNLLVAGYVVLALKWQLADASWLAFMSGCIAGSFSPLPLVLWQPGLRWVLLAPAQAAQWQRLIILVLGTGAVAVGLAAGAFREVVFRSELKLLWLALPYLLAALAVAATLYRPWLRHPR